MTLTITYLGHAGFLLTDGSATVAIDPWLTGNPMATMSADAITCDAVIVTHGHADHMTDVEQIAKQNDATVFGAWEVHEYLVERGYQKTEPGNVGGKISVDWGWVAFTPALHSSSFEARYMGMPMGAVVNIAGMSVYHLGDTGLFTDLKLMGELYRPDIACIPVGDRFTMGPELASRAAEYIKPRVAIPIHYKTFPLLTSDISGFAPKGVEVKEMEPGEVWEV
jgi:L-ascorbate metabolism protein UlaG (beta-lactamase superfamily)